MSDKTDITLTINGRDHRCCLSRVCVTLTFSKTRKIGVRRFPCSLNAKREKLNQPGFQRFPQELAFIYDEPGLETILSHMTVRAVILPAFSRRVRRFRDYDTIFLLSHRYLFRFHDGKLSLNYRF